MVDSNFMIFNMGAPYVKSGTRKAFAMLSNNWIIPEHATCRDRNRILCGQLEPMITDIEVYALKFERDQ